jgi:hypothetical protein
LTEGHCLDCLFPGSRDRRKSQFLIFMCAINLVLQL